MSLLNPSPSPHCGTYDSEEERATGKLPDASNLVIEGNAVSLEEATLQAPTHEAGFTEHTAERPGPKKTSWVPERPH